MRTYVQERIVTGAGRELVEQAEREVEELEEGELVRVERTGRERRWARRKNHRWCQLPELTQQIRHVGQHLQTALIQRYICTEYEYMYTVQYVTRSKDCYLVFTNILIGFNSDLDRCLQMKNNCTRKYNQL